MTLIRSKSLPGVGGDLAGGASWRGDEESSQGPSGIHRDSGLGACSSEHQSFMSDPRSSLVGELISGGLASELPSAEGAPGKQPSIIVDDENKRPTIGRHYYPEGGWGWIVLVASLAVHMLSHGLHLAGGTFLACVSEKFPNATPLSRGKYYVTKPRQCPEVSTTSHRQATVQR